MPATSRFECVSSGLSLAALLAKAGRVLWSCLAVGVAIHLSLTQTGGVKTQRRMAKPLTTHFVKRQPRLSKPLELKKRPQPRRRQIRRQVVSVKARSILQQGPARFQPSQVLTGLSRPTAEIGRLSRAEGMALEPQMLALAIEGQRETQQKIDTSLELLDIEALDTGQYHALIVQDPHDKRSVRGFCHLAIAYSRTLYGRNAGDRVYSFESYFLPGFLRIPIAMNKYTDIKTDVLGRLSLGDAEIFKAPWLVFFGMWHSFELNPTEQEGLGKYLMAGGFVFEDARNYWDSFAEKEPAYLSLRNATLEALAVHGVDARFEKLPNSHPIYHCYFDFDGPPMGADAADNSIHADQVHILTYLEGIEIDGRLVALLSGKCYAHAWTFWGPGKFVGYGSWVDWDPTRAFQFAVNTIIFALTQEGSVTHRLMESIH